MKRPNFISPEISFQYTEHVEATIISINFSLFFSVLKEVWCLYSGKNFPYTEESLYIFIEIQKWYVSVMGKGGKSRG